MVAKDQILVQDIIHLLARGSCNHMTFNHALLVILAVHESWPLLKKAHRVMRRMLSMFASTTPPGEGNISGMWNGLQEEPAIDNLCANHHAQYEFIKTEQ